MIEVISIGQMQKRGDALLIRYDEVVDEDDQGIVQTAKNELTIREDQVEIIKEGPNATHMVFMPGQTTYTYYATPMGELEVGIHSTCVEKTDNASGFLLHLQYELEMNQTFISFCDVNVAIEY